MLRFGVVVLRVTQQPLTTPSMPPTHQTKTSFPSKRRACFSSAAARTRPPRCAKRAAIAPPEQAAFLLSLTCHPGPARLTQYINANFVSGYDDARKRFIAAQGPKTNTIAHFWCVAPFVAPCPAA